MGGLSCLENNIEYKKMMSRFKKYNEEDMKRAFIATGINYTYPLPVTCVDCGGDLESTDDYDYIKDSRISYVCLDCTKKYMYKPSDCSQAESILFEYE